MAQVRQETIKRVYIGKYCGIWMAQETAMPLRDTFPNGKEDIGKDALDKV
jgi:hypothetical protein